MNVIRFIAMLLVIVGALNWGLWGFFQYDLVAGIFEGASTGWARVIYALIGLAGLFGISFFFCKGLYCSSAGGSCCSSGGGSCCSSGGGSCGSSGSDEGRDQGQNQ